MSRLNLLHLSAVLVSITCCTLLSPAKAESFEVSNVQTANGAMVELGKLRDTREAGQQKRRRRNRRIRNRTNRKDESKNRKPERQNNGNKKKPAKDGKRGKRKNTSKKGKGGRRKKTNKKGNGGKRNKASKNGKGGRRKKSNKKVNGGKRNKSDKKEETGKKNSKGNGKSNKGKRKQAKGKKARRIIRRRNKNNRAQRQAEIDNCIKRISGLNELSNKPYRTARRLLPRIQGFKDGMTRKEEKANFDTNRETLIKSLGGDSLSPKCGGDIPETNDTEILRTLVNCNTMVATECNVRVTQNMTDIVTSCQTVLNQTGKSYDLLNSLTSWNSSTLKLCVAVNDMPANFEQDVIDCKNNLVTVHDNIKIQKDKCFTEFSNCRKAEREALAIVDKCKPNAGGFTNYANAKRQLEILKGLLDAAQSFLDAINAAFDSLLPTTTTQSLGRMQLRRGKRQSGDGPECTALLDELNRIKSLTVNASGSANSSVDATAAAQVTSAFASLTNRATLERDLKTCEEEGGAKQGGLAIIQIRLLIEFLIDWIEKVIIPKMTIIAFIFPSLQTPTTPAVTTTTTTTITTSTVTTTIEPTTAVTTVAPVRRGKILRELNLFRKF